MTKAFGPDVLSQLRQINDGLREQAMEIASLRATADVQFKRIAQMQAELDLRSVARQRSETVRALQLSVSHDHNNGTSRSQEIRKHFVYCREPARQS